MMTTFLSLIKIMFALVIVCYSWSSSASALPGSPLASNSSGSKSSHLNGSSPQPPPLALKSASSSGLARGSDECFSDHVCYGLICVDGKCTCPVGYTEQGGQFKECKEVNCKFDHNPKPPCWEWQNTYCDDGKCICDQGFHLVKRNTRCEEIPTESTSTTSSTTTSTTPSTTCTSPSPTASSTSWTASSWIPGWTTETAAKMSTSTDLSAKVGAFLWKICLWIIGIGVVIFLVAICIAIVVCCYCCKSDKSKQARYNNKSNAPMAPSKYPPMVGYPTPGSSDYGKGGPIMVAIPGTSGLKASKVVGSNVPNPPMALYPVPGGYPQANLVAVPGPSGSKDSKEVPSNGS